MTDDDQSAEPADRGRESKRQRAVARRRRSMQRTPRAVRRFQLLVLAIGAAIVLGMAALWPADDSAVPSPDSKLPPSERALVTETDVIPCAAGAQDECLQATIRLESGPDRGRSSSLVVGQAGNEVQVEKGDQIRVVKNRVPEGGSIGGVEVPPYSLNDFERRSPLIWLAGIFALVVLGAGRWQGLRALVGLVASVGVVVVFLVPALLQGKQPLAVAFVGAMAVMLLTIPLSHGVGAKTIAATLGTTFSLMLTLALSLLFVKLAHLTGFAGDEVAYLKSYLGDLSIQGLLLAGIVVSALGVLDDVTVSQASTVLALRRANPALRFRELYSGALSVGRDHITATVNTLVLAYVGASLPVLLTFSLGQASAGDAVNSEAVASQIVATLVGSLGLIAAVPITTAVAAWLAVRVDESALVDAHPHVHAH